jgi:HEXXH motif-containing protein
VDFWSWGAILLAANEERDVLDLVQAIVHESAHLILFAQAIDGPLVTNDPDETYTSPLRQDLRSMDGIFHATFVSARMYQAVSKMQKRKELTSTMLNAAAHAVDKNREQFYDNYRVISEAAMLTTLGKTLISEAAEYLNW